MKTTKLSRRRFVTLAAVAPWAARIATAAGKIPMGIEMYSVRDDLKKDPKETVRQVAAIGYAGLEFYAPYFQWTLAQAQDMKKLMDDLGIRCFSTHNDPAYLNKDNIQKTAELNNALGSKYAVISMMKPGPDGWQNVTDALNFAADGLQSSGLKTGYHNHDAEFTKTNGSFPMEFIAKNTKPTVMLQLDVGTCVAAGADPVAWIKSNPGRIRSLHCKDWAPGGEDKGYHVLFGEGVSPWKEIFAAASTVGGAEYYLMEQEGSRYSEMETAKMCLETYKTKFA
jgi:sugar phosphate isomerase/epimerase